VENRGENTMKEKGTVNGMAVTAKVWEKYGKRRVYFTFDVAPGAGSAKLNQACYDCDKEEFTACKANIMESRHLSNVEIRSLIDGLVKEFEL
jgi:hypothetical protein